MTPTRCVLITEQDMDRLARTIGAGESYVHPQKFAAEFFDSLTLAPMLTEKEPSQAPIHFDNPESMCWADGYNSAIEDLKKLGVIV